MRVRLLIDSDDNNPELGQPTTVANLNFDANHSRY